MVTTKQKNIRLSPLSTHATYVSYKVALALNIFSIIALSSAYVFLFHKADLGFSPKATDAVFYTDRVNQGQSVINQSFQSEDGVGITCTLKKGFMFPYSGFELLIPQNKELDVAAYDKITVEVSSHNIQQLSMYVLFKDPATKNIQHELALRRASTDLTLTQTKQRLTLDVSSFVTPNWWYAIVGQAKTDFTDPKLNKFRGFIFSTGIGPALDQPCTFAVHKITFHKDQTWTIACLVLLQMLVSLVTIYLYYFKKSPATTMPVAVKVQYKAVSVPDQFAGHNYRFLDYIHQNFTDAELTLSQISKSTGMSEKTISQTIAERFDCNLKTYINKIRIAESQRLLLESRLSISEIAYKTGFNSPANFNRVFRSFTEESPSEYLQKHMPK